VEKNSTSWGYGEDPKTLEEFYRRFEGLCRVLLEQPRMFGYCYTQLTDVYQEQNGIFCFDRTSKFDLKRLREIQQRMAAIEQEGDEITKWGGVVRTEGDAPKDQSWRSPLISHQLA